MVTANLLLVLNLALLAPTLSFLFVVRKKNKLCATSINRLVSAIKTKETSEVELDGIVQNDVINLHAFQGLEECTSTTQARKILENKLFNKNVNGSALFKSISIPAGASAKGISEGDLAIQTRLGNKKYKITELIELNGNRDIDRASVSVFSVTIASVIAVIAVNQNLPGPDIIRFFIVWVITFTPLFFIGFGIKDSEKLQTFLVTIQRNLFPGYRKRMIQHEAGHFLMAHLLGWPIAGYQTNAIKNAVEFFPLSDDDFGRDLARQLGFDRPATSIRLNDLDPAQSGSVDIPFFSKDGRGATQMEKTSVFRKNGNYSENSFLRLSSSNEPTNSWPYRGFDEATIDQLTVISVAGVCAEILAFGNAEGGLADVSQLKKIFNSSEIGKSEREIENRIRFALGYTMSQLRLHLGVLDDLAEVMDRGGSVAECVMAIEMCRNRKGTGGLNGDYEARRRNAYRSEELNIFEQIFLGNDRNIDTIENRFIEGKGGGYRKKMFRVVGDDPLYVSLAVSFAFLVWASSGGLTLH